MSSKVAPSTGAGAVDYIALFESFGLTRAKAAEAVKSPKVAAVLAHIIESHELVAKKVDAKQTVLLSALAVLGAKNESIQGGKLDYTVNAIISGKLKTTDQVSAAAKYLETHEASPIDEADFDHECGVGFSISPEQLRNVVKTYVDANPTSGWASLGPTISGLKSTPELRWANPLDVKNITEQLFTEIFGPKETGKAKGKESKLESGKSKAPAEAVATASEAANPLPKKTVFEEGFLGALHKPGGNPQIHSRLREAHLAATGGQVITRFPPEPNGYLHVGHSKAIFINFGYAAHNGGHCILRYDDTNPEKEEGRYFDSILETIRWLGYEPWKVTYSSDYFQELYDLAEELIRRDKAYVCHCTAAEIQQGRGGEKGEGGPRRACAHRSRPIEESIAEFRKMRDGHYRPKEANLRMKQDLEDGNPQMWDLIAYRVLESPHHRTADKWRIYPTYDFTHCLVDSMENISHSLCTTEFVASRQSYDWLCDVLEVYKPRQSEYGRLSLQGTITSKRKLLALVDEGYVSGWDDPRLYTVIALRRRGVPPGAIISFVSELGVSTSGSNIELKRFDQTVRQYLESTVPRLLMVLRPLKVTLGNVPEDYMISIEKPLHPKVPELGTSSVPFTRTLYIDKDDFRLQDSKDYFRLAPGKTVGLFQAPYPITCISYKTDEKTGEVVELICRLENEGAVKKPKAFIQWVAEHVPSDSPVVIDEARIFHPLFNSDNPAAVRPDFRSDVNKDSLEVMKGAMVEVGFFPLARKMLAEANRLSEERTKEALKTIAGDVPSRSTGDHSTPHVSTDQLVGKECVRFQGLRVAYFALDTDSRVACLENLQDGPSTRKQGDYLVLNRIVSLKEDAGKGA